MRRRAGLLVWLSGGLISLVILVAGALLINPLLLGTRSSASYVTLSPGNSAELNYPNGLTMTNGFSTQLGNAQVRLSLQTDGTLLASLQMDCGLAQSIKAISVRYNRQSYAAQQNNCQFNVVVPTPRDRTAHSLAWHLRFQNRKRPTIRTRPIFVSRNGTATVPDVVEDQTLPDSTDPDVVVDENIPDITPTIQPTTLPTMTPLVTPPPPVTPVPGVVSLGLSGNDITVTYGNQTALVSLSNNALTASGFSPTARPKVINGQWIDANHFILRYEFVAPVPDPARPTYLPEPIRIVEDVVLFGKRSDASLPLVVGRRAVVFCQPDGNLSSACVRPNGITGRNLYQYPIRDDSYVPDNPGTNLANSPSLLKYQYGLISAYSTGGGITITPTALRGQPLTGLPQDDPNNRLASGAVVGINSATANIYGPTIALSLPQTDFAQGAMAKFVSRGKEYPLSTRGCDTATYDNRGTLNRGANIINQFFGRDYSQGTTPVSFCYFTNVDPTGYASILNTRIPFLNGEPGHFVITNIAKQETVISTTITFWTVGAFGGGGGTYINPGSYAQ